MELTKWMETQNQRKRRETLKVLEKRGRTNKHRMMQYDVNKSFGFERTVLLKSYLGFSLEVYPNLPTCRKYSSLVMEF